MYVYKYYTNFIGFNSNNSYYGTLPCGLKIMANCIHILKIYY